MNLEQRILYGKTVYQPKIFQSFSIHDCQSIANADRDLRPFFADPILLSWSQKKQTRTLLLHLQQSVSLEPGFFQADLELLVISGDLRLGEWHLGKHGYCYIPKGFAINGLEALSPVTLLWMENGPATFVPGESHPDADWESFIPPLDSKLLPWGAAETQQFVTSRKKYLRKDPRGGGTWLLAVLPHYYAKGGMIQSYNEEAYILSGSIWIGDHLLEAHHYSYAPVFTTVGRHVTDEGVLCFVRVDRDLTVPGRVITYPHPLYSSLKEGQKIFG